MNTRLHNGNADLRLSNTIQVIMTYLMNCLSKNSNLCTRPFMFVLQCTHTEVQFSVGYFILPNASHSGMTFPPDPGTNAEYS